MELLCPKGSDDANAKRKLDINMEDKVIRGMTVVKGGIITWPPPEDVTKIAAAAKVTRTESEIWRDDHAVQKTTMFSKRVFDLTTIGELLAVMCGGVFFGVVARYAHYFFVNMLLYFILAGFLGYYLILNVEPALFSPLMSTSNSLSGVVILGGMVLASLPNGSVSQILGSIAISVAAINVFGGFAVSYRMLLMFKSES